MTAFVTELPYADADKQLHIPGCGQLVIADFNSMPQSAWHSDTQLWECEGCGVRMQRHLRNSRWGVWAAAGWPCGESEPHEPHTWEYLHPDDQRACTGIPPR